MYAMLFSKELEIFLLPCLPAYTYSVTSHKVHLLQPTFTGKVRTLWTGVGATLLKDVPFAGLYWSLLEPFKRVMASTQLSNPSKHSNVSPISPSSLSTIAGITICSTWLCNIRAETAANVTDVD